MIIKPSTLRLLKQHGLLRGSFARGLREKAPLRYDAGLIAHILYFKDLGEFLSKYTLEEIGRELDWVRTYAMVHHKRFPLPEVEERMRKDPNQWRWYLQGLMNSPDTNREDSTWAVGEEIKRFGKERGR